MFYQFSGVYYAELTNDDATTSQGIFLFGSQEHLNKSCPKVGAIILQGVSTAGKAKIMEQTVEEKIKPKILFGSPISLQFFRPRQVLSVCTSPCVSICPS